MSLLQRAPRMAVVEAVREARELYGVEAEARPLPSERDQNFLLESDRGCFILKYANGTEPRAILDAQNAAMTHLADRVPFCPRVLPSIAGDLIAQSSSGHFVRLVTWLPGVPFGSLRHHPPALLEDLGRRVAELDRALESFDHPALHREFHWDLAHALGTVVSAPPRVADAESAALVSRDLERMSASLPPRLGTLRRSIAHNDANDYNVLVLGTSATRDLHVSGLIDFGDMLHTVTVADLAVAIAYAVLDKRDPLTAAAHIVRGYHSANPLNEEELSILFELVKLRLYLSVVLAVDQGQQRPDDPYLTISQQGIRRTLPALLAIHPRFAEAAFRLACGLDGSPRTVRVARWLTNRPAPSSPVLGGPAGLADAMMPLDLGVASPLVSGDPDENAAGPLGKRIAEAMMTAGAQVAAGGYLEPRILYSSTLFASAQDGERRTVHLGVDFFAPEGTPVCAALDGTVHAFADNRQPLDYGPVIILRHETDERDEFFTLYGHLTRESLAGLESGKRVKARDILGAIGAAAVNGGWVPHLHLQLITDLLDRGCDVPGVSRPADSDVWAALSPDPNLLLRIPDNVLPARGVAAATPRSARKARAQIGPSVRPSYAEPLTIVRGWMQYLFDADGRRFLDGYNNVPHVGHSHPRVAEAAARQLRTLNTNTRYLHDSLERFAAALTSTLPAPLSVCYFVNSGSEANELALRLARAYTRQRGVVILEHAYHGITTTLTEISPYKFDGPGGEGRQPWVHVAPVPDGYRGRHRGTDAATGRKYADDAAATVEAAERSGHRIGAFLAESAPSVAGQIIMPPGYLAQVYESIRSNGGVCIADEVQTAYGRMGTHFYAFEAQRVVPDIVVLGKPIGNGYPIGAVVTTRAIAEAFDNGMEFFSTFGGSTVACAVGIAVLDVVQQQGLTAHAARVGGALLASLNELEARHPVVGDVRGSGLFLGVELVTDPEARAPAPREASYAVNRLKEEGILIGTDGPDHNVLKIRPPMPFSSEDADRLVAVLDRVLSELE
jgi:4-aminobutyrate aminotransferase-like enzyme/Ser/Thr protein kinase RdoA (MazF antagonist)